jgi:alpha-tubulin suppressor-like RCC1 family protein
MGVTGAADLSAGKDLTCARLSNGTVQCWGCNLGGELGNGQTSTTVSSPVSVSGLSQVTAIAGGGAHTCALSSNGAVQCWGENANGQLGNGSSPTPSSTPVAVTGLPSNDPVVSVAAGDQHSCAVLQSGNVQCWGSNAAGQLGNTTVKSTTSTPVAVKGLSGAVASVACGGAHTCARLQSGALQCWGDDRSGQVGNGSVGGSIATPTTVSSLGSAVAVAAGLRSTCAIVSGGTVWCWGQVPGTSLTSTASVPAAVVGLGGGDAGASLGVAMTIAVGDQFACVGLQTGGAACWGQGSWGQLGNGKVTSTTTPVMVQ